MLCFWALRGCSSSSDREFHLSISWFSQTIMLRDFQWYISWHVWQKFLVFSVVSFIAVLANVRIFSDVHFIAVLNNSASVFSDVCFIDVLNNSAAVFSDILCTAVLTIVNRLCQLVLAKLIRALNCQKQLCLSGCPGVSMQLLNNLPARLNVSVMFSCLLE